MGTVYRYTGPVMKFDSLICPKWVGETTAVSPKKALSNLAYQFKKNNGLVAGSKITLQERYLEVVGYAM